MSGRRGEVHEARLAQASAGELGHVELLQSLCEDESTRRDAVGLERRLKAARFEQSCAIEDFDFAFNPKIPATQIRDLATLRFIEAGESVILHGPVGVGKSMIATGARSAGLSTRLFGALHQDVRACWRTWPADTPIGASSPD